MNETRRACRAFWTSARNGALRKACGRVRPGEDVFKIFYKRPKFSVCERNQSSPAETFPPNRLRLKTKSQIENGDASTGVPPRRVSPTVRRKKMKSVLSGDRCVGKNTFHGADCASVASAGSAVQLSEKMLAFFRSVATLSTRRAARRKLFRRAACEELVEIVLKRTYVRWMNRAPCFRLKIKDVFGDAHAV